MNTNAIIEKAICEVIGTRPKPGSIVAMRSEKTCWELIRYDGDVAVVNANGTEHSWPASEVFDVNEVRRRSQRIQAEDVVESAEMASVN